MNKTGEYDVQRDSVKSTPLAIIGIGSMFPDADNTDRFWTNIKQGVDAIKDVPESHWRSDDYYHQDPKSADKVYARMGGFLSPVDFNPMDYGILPNAIEAIDTSQLLGLLAVEQALNDAGYTTEKEFDRDQVSVILGVTGTLELVIPLGARLGYPRWREALKDAGVDDRLAEDVMERISESYVPWQENSFPGLLGNVVAGRISKHFDLGGTNCVVDAACGSSLSALNLAALELISGRSDMVITGGIDTFNDIFMYTCFSKTPALSPTGHARPYDDASDGTTLGEGLGIVVLKRLEDAERDGDKIYAVIKGIGSSSDGKGAAIYEPDAGGQAKALQRAYRQSNVSPDTIELIEGHGTGTRVGDAVEVSALQDVFGTAETPWCALGSIKSQIGHTKAAAGVAGLIKASLALYHKVLPPTIKVNKPHSSLLADSSPFYVNTEIRPWTSRPNHPRRAGVSALGFGGSNFHCLLEEHRQDKFRIDWDGDSQILPFSADSRNGLLAKIEEFPPGENWRQIRLLAARARQNYNPQDAHRLVLILERGELDLPEQLEKAAALVKNSSDEQYAEMPGGDIHYGSGLNAGSLGVLFPGQGAQYPGMLKQLALHFPEFLDVLDAAEESYAVVGRQPGKALSNAIYPQPAFDESIRNRQVAELTATETAQPALGAVSLGALRVLEYFGLTAQAAAGHSYGELVALCGAGVMSDDDLFRLSRLRGEMMAAGEGDRGSMAAVSAPLTDIERMIRDNDLKLVLANRNTPNQGVLSGPTAEIDRACSLLKEQGIGVKKLDVAAAFHSSLVADAAQPFAEELAKIAFNPARIAVFANRSGKQYPAETAGVRDLLAEQLANSVQFVDEIRSMYEAGVRTFVEVGPGARLTGMVKAILQDSDYHCLALDASNGRRSGMTDLARVLAKLAALGHNIDLALWDGDYSREHPATESKKRGISVTLTGANHFKRPEKRPPLEIQPQKVNMPVHEQPDHASREVTAAASQTASVRNDVDSLREALKITQQSLKSLQSLQEQTAQLHQQFLTGQQAATQSFMTLVQQQQQLVQGVPLATPPAVDRTVQPLSSVTDQAMQMKSQPLDPAMSVAATPQPADTRNAAISDVGDVLLKIVAEKTGYPVEMLELEMSLDGDLGIDSIKRVEILSALQEKLPELPAVKPEDLGVLQTLGQIVDHLSESGGQRIPTIPAVSQTTTNRSEVTTTLLDVIAEKTGYPVDMLELEMALDSDLGIDSIKRVEILSALQEKLPELPAVKPEDLGVLQTLGQIVDHLTENGRQRIATIPAVAQTTTNRSEVTTTLLDVIAEKTGYPVDMLELDMALDSDLGIDSIKRVEILSSLQEQLPELPAVKPEDLGVLQTLGQIVDHLTSAGSQRIETIPPAPQMGTLDKAVVSETLLSVIAEKTGYPVDMLELEMALDSDLGIDSIKRVEILSALQEKLSGAPAVKPEHLGTLQTVAQIVDFLATSQSSQEENRCDCDDVEVPKGIKRQVLKLSPLALKRAQIDFKGAPGNEVWITDDGSALADALCTRLTARGVLPKKVSLKHIETLEETTALSGLVILAPLKGSDDDFLKKSFQLVRQYGTALNRTAQQGGAFLATVSRLNGCFGLNADRFPLNDILSGGLAGLCKTAALEWPSLHCKAIDLAMGMEIESTAENIVDEIFRQSPVEVGVTSRGLQSLELDTVTLDGSLSETIIREGELVVISGGARGVTAEVAVALAGSFKATLLLLGRSPMTEEEPSWLAGLTLESEIKQAIMAHAEKPLKPIDVNKEFEHVRAQREIRTNIDRILNAGATPIYRAVDLRDAEAVAAIISALREIYGPVKGVIHGAGVLADKLIVEKTDEQYSSVYSTKVDGLRSIMSATEQDNLDFIALFSSSTARFGRVGQVDYAMANEVLNKMAQQRASVTEDCRVVSLNWGPWNGGMVTPALKKVFSREGIDVIDLKSGADYLLEELSVKNPAVEIVITGTHESDKQVPEEEPHQNIYQSKAFDLDLSVDEFPFLKSHVMDGRAVLPMAVIVEWLAHGAVHNNPGLKFQGFNDLRILKGVVLEQDEMRELQVMTGKAIKSDGVHVVPVELSSCDATGKTQIHARSRVILSTKLPEKKAVSIDPDTHDYPHDDQSIYRSQRLFHGKDFYGIRDIYGCSSSGITAFAKAAPQPGNWINQPLRNVWFSDPLALDSSFQLMILWSFEQYSAGSLPVYAERYRQFREHFPADGVEIRVEIVSRDNNKALADIEFIDPGDKSLVARLEHYECVIDASLNASFQRNKLTGVA